MQNMQFIYLRKRNEETVLKHAPFKNPVQLNPCSAAGDLFAYVIFFKLETIFFFFRCSRAFITLYNEEL